VDIPLVNSCLLAPEKINKALKNSIYSDLPVYAFAANPSLLLIASSHPHQSHCRATPLSQALPQSFFCRPAGVVAPELIGCLLVKRQPNGELLWGVLVETEAYSQEEPACHGYCRRTPSNETLFSEADCGPLVKDINNISV